MVILTSERCYDFSKRVNSFWMIDSPEPDERNSWEKHKCPPTQIHYTHIVREQKHKQPTRTAWSGGRSYKYSTASYRYYTTTATNLCVRTCVCVCLVRMCMCNMWLCVCVCVPLHSRCSSEVCFVSPSWGQPSVLIPSGIPCPCWMPIDKKLWPSVKIRDKKAPKPYTNRLQANIKAKQYLALLYTFYLSFFPWVEVGRVELKSCVCWLKNGSWGHC